MLLMINNHAVTVTGGKSGRLLHASLGAL